MSFLTGMVVGFVLFPVILGIAYGIGTFLFPAYFVLSILYRVLPRAS